MFEKSLHQNQVNVKYRSTKTNSIFQSLKESDARCESTKNDEDDKGEREQHDEKLSMDGTVSEENDVEKVKSLMERLSLNKSEIFEIKSAEDKSAENKIDPKIKPTEEAKLKK